MKMMTTMSQLLEREGGQQGLTNPKEGLMKGLRITMKTQQTLVLIRYWHL